MENNNPTIGTPEQSDLPVDTGVEATPVASTQSAEAPTDVSAVSQPTASQQPEAPQQAYNPYQQSETPQQAYNPYQPQTNTYNYAANPYQTYAPAAAKPKKSVGKIISLILGILLTIVGAFLTFAITVASISEYNDYGVTEIYIPVVIIVLLPLIIGIILIVFGCKKSNKNQQTAAVTAMPYNTNYSAAYQQNASQPAVQTANQQPSQPIDGHQSAAGASDATQAAPMAANAQPNANPVSAQMTYQYAPTVPIQDDSQKSAKKSARNSGLAAIGISLAMWVMIFGFNYVAVGYVTILPILLAFNGLKSNIKSVASWLGMIFSILTAILAVFVYFAF